MYGTYGTTLSEDNNFRSTDRPKDLGLIGTEPMLEVAHEVQTGEPTSEDEDPLHAVSSVEGSVATIRTLFAL
jgi:hypothetical protein